MTATDGREPEKTANATVTVNIIRDESSPAFIDAPYTDARVSENTAVGSEFYAGVRAEDRDLQVFKAKQTVASFRLANLFIAGSLLRIISHLHYILNLFPYISFELHLHRPLFCGYKCYAMSHCIFSILSMIIIQK